VPPLAAGLPALAALCLLPGLLVVRAPWTAVPALSLSFWALSAWWLPHAGRGRLLSAVLLLSALLAALRLLPKHEVPPPPGWEPPPAPPPVPRPGLDPPPIVAGPSLLVIAAALALLAPAPLWHHAPGPRLAFQTTTARLLLWRDGVPVSGEPLLPLAPVGAHAPAVATLAADVSALGGLDPAPALVLVVAAAAALVLVGLFALQAAWIPPLPAALGAVVGLAAAPWPGALAPLGEAEALLALAFALPAAALLAGHASRSSSLAAGMLLAAAALAHPLVAAGAGLAAAGLALRRRPGSAGRLAGAIALALLLAAPGLWPLARALSADELFGVLQSVRPAELPAVAVGLLLAAVAAPGLARLAGPLPLARRLAAGALALVGAALLVVRLHGWIAAGQLPAATREALARVEAATGPLAVVCASEAARDWVPALAGRAAGEPGPWVPPPYAEEWSRRPIRPCSSLLD
jgi:hypothetical protein